MKTSPVADGKILRQTTSRKSQSTFKLNSKRPSVAKMITDSNYDRMPSLVPIRHYRMSASPFAFYRGTASIMARDLSILPNTGVNVQCIGDCHLLNFGGFATQERTLIFDVNDFDEAHPAPWEWDLKRLATSFVVAARYRNFSDDYAKGIAYSLAKSYRENMKTFSQMNMLDLWYMKFDFQSILNNAKNEKAKRQLEEKISKAEKGTHQQTFYKITSNVLGNFEILDQKPLVFHPVDVKKEKELIVQFMDQYCNSLQNDRCWLFDQYKIIDLAVKVVGVGSVGTRCFVVLFMNEKHEPLFLQLKEARQSVLEPYTQKSNYAHNGQRVVEGQRLIQAASDIFLGWSTGPAGRHFYLRQLRDKKMAFKIDLFDKDVLESYADVCGRALARAYAKTGNAPVLSSYMGNNDILDEAISTFAMQYADQTEKDYVAFMKAIKSSKLAVESDESITESMVKS